MYRLFMMLFGRRIAEQCYIGVLGRPGDPTGLAGYTRELARYGRLDKVLAAMARSQESWQRSLGSQPEALVRLAYGAILERPPSDEELAEATTSLTATPDGFADLLGRLAGRRPRRGWQPSEADELVRAVFQGLLAREPDDGAMTGYREFLVSSQDPAAVIADVGGSDEHWDLLVARHSRSLVQTVFRTLLQRDADPAALDMYSKRLEETRDLAGLIDDIGTSREHRNLLLRRLASADMKG